MKPPIRKEHLLKGEVNCNQGWVPAICFIRLGQDPLIDIRLSQEVNGIMNAVAHGLDDFALCITTLLVQSGICKDSDGPVWRHQVSVPSLRNNVHTLRLGILTIIGTSDCPEMTLQIENDPETRASWDIYQVLSQITGIRCCANCQNGLYMIYGGQDTLFDLYCFRDVQNFQGKETAKVFPSNDWDTVAYPHAPALHWCPAWQQQEGSPNE